MRSSFFSVSSFVAVSIIFAVSIRKFMVSTKRFYAEKEDLISELPRDIIDNIFDRLPTRDAARTSILSRKWRYIWASYPQLVFDYIFFKELYNKHKEFVKYEFLKVINNALLVHSGHILKFVLHFPSFPHDLSLDLENWMLFLSSNGIKELELYCLNPTPFIVPSCIFSCSSLLNLRLRNCILKPPCDFEGIRYLVNLILLEVSFSSSFPLKNPSLERLAIINCTGIEHKNIYAPRLNFFCMIDSGEVDWQWLIASNKKLVAMHIELGMEVKNVEHTMNMMKFLAGIPKVEMIFLDGFSLKYLATSNPHKVFQHQNLIPSLITYIILRDFGVDDLNQISSTLCLLKNCPNLIAIDIEISAHANEAKEPVREYLEPSNCMDVSLNMLQRVIITYMKGIMAELLLLKVLLARSTCLQRIIIKPNSAISDGDSFKILRRELLRFPPASSSVEVIYADPLAVCR